MNTWEQQLVGELVGLARATEGNEHLITESVTKIIADVLTARIQNEAQYAVFFNKIVEVKREIVPDCFFCANPCGRTSAFDLRELARESEQVRRTKFDILEQLRTLAASQRNAHTDQKLYRGLMIIGLDGYSSAELTELFSTE